MEKWEYWPLFLTANIENNGVQEYVQKRWPGWDPPKFTPYLLIPELDKLGEEGWELVHMEPIQRIGQNADVGFDFGGPAVSVTHWSNVYFCVFKRRKPTSP